MATHSSFQSTWFDTQSTWDIFFGLAELWHGLMGGERRIQGEPQVPLQHGHALTTFPPQLHGTRDEIKNPFST